MTSDRIFAALAAYLEPRVKAAGGVFSPSDTVDATLGLLAQAPTSWRCILQWQREDPTKARHEMRLVLLLIVQQGRGLAASPGAGLTLPAHPAQPSLLQRFNTTAAWLRAIVFTDPDIEKAPIAQGPARWITFPAEPASPYGLQAAWLAQPPATHTRQIGAEFSLAYGLAPLRPHPLQATP